MIILIYQPITWIEDNVRERSDILLNYFQYCNNIVNVIVAIIEQLLELDRKFFRDFDFFL